MSLSGIGMVLTGVVAIPEGLTDPTPGALGVGLKPIGCSCIFLSTNHAPAAKADPPITNGAINFSILAIF